MEIVIGDKLWSSWSMRPWLALKRTGAEFTETLVALRRETTPQALRSASPSGMVPVLKDDSVTIWDSLAICEYLAERFPEAKLWPSDAKARAIARAATAEMHSGFASLRGECAMDLSMQKPTTLSEATQVNIQRIVHLWTELKAYGGGGAFLFGDWSIADAFYTPVATRFRSYGVRLSDYGDMGVAGVYAEALLETPEYLAWERGALQGAA